MAPPVCAAHPTDQTTTAWRRTIRGAGTREGTHPRREAKCWVASPGNAGKLGSQPGGGYGRDQCHLGWRDGCWWFGDPARTSCGAAQRGPRRAASPPRCRRAEGLGATLALALSLLVVTLTVLCVVGGVAVAILGRHSPLLVGLGLIVAVTAVAVFPRPLRLGEGDVLLDRSHAAQFWELLFEIAHVVKTPPPELVVVDMEPNASVTNVGLRSRAVLRLGAPLWAILDGQERVGLLAHELGHLAHRRSPSRARGRARDADARSMEARPYATPDDTAGRTPSMDRRRHGDGSASGRPPLERRHRASAGIGCSASRAPIRPRRGPRRWLGRLYGPAGAASRQRASRSGSPSGRSTPGWR